MLAEELPISSLVKFLPSTVIEGGMDNIDEVNPGDTIMLMDDEDLVTFILLTRFFSGEHEYVALTSADEDSEPDEIVVILNRIERNSDGTYLVESYDHGGSVCGDPGSRTPGPTGAPTEPVRFAGIGFLSLWERRWEVDLVRTLTLILVVCGLLFTGLSYLTRAVGGEPRPSQAEAFRALAAYPPGTVFSHQDNGFYIEYFSGKRAYIDNLLTHPDLRRIAVADAAALILSDMSMKRA